MRSLHSMVPEPTFIIHCLVLTHSSWVRVKIFHRQIEQRKSFIFISKASSSPSIFHRKLREISCILPHSSPSTSEQAYFQSSRHQNVCVEKIKKRWKLIFFISWKAVWCLFVYFVVVVHLKLSHLCLMVKTHPWRIIKDN